MAWRVFAGELSNVFTAFLTLRARADGLGDGPDAVAHCLRLHLHRGLGYLSSGKEIKSIDGFLNRWVYNQR